MWRISRCSRASVTTTRTNRKNTQTFKCIENVHSVSMVKCSQCNSEYDKIGQHWSMSNSCVYPELTTRQTNLLTGIIMGDGWVNGHSGSNPFIGVKMINEQFLNWLDLELGVLSTGVVVDKTADESSSEVKEWKGVTSDTSTVYKLRTRRHPNLQQFWGWYSGGSKSFPNNIDFNPTTLKMWYVCDGSYGSATSPYITTANEAENADRIADNISNQTQLTHVTVNNLTNGKRIVFPYSSTQEFFEYIGDPVPGFEHKWPETVK